MAEGESAQKHLLGMNELCDWLAAMELPVPEEFQPLMILASLPASYTAIVQTLGSQAGKLDMTHVTSTVLDEDARRRENGSHSDQALVWGKTDEKSRQERTFTCPVLQLREDGTIQQGMPRSTEAAYPSSIDPSRRNEAENE